VPHRYHAHWSGSGIDGEVAGFFVAVTETLPPIEGIVRLPAPKPQDYKFTTQTDSMFVFSIHEAFSQDREHALYVYAVDNEGKVDPDPAYVRFTARDRNMPGLFLTAAWARGRVFDRDVFGNVIGPIDFERHLTDPTDPVGATVVPWDTIPVGSEAYFEWRGWDDDWNSAITGYRYKLMEPEFVSVDSTVRSVEYDTGVGDATVPIPTGLGVFHIKSVDEAGGSTLTDTLRRMQVNFSSDTWWAGPNPDDPLIAPALEEDMERGGTYLVSPDGQNPPPELDRWFSQARFDSLPHERTAVKTFIEEVSRKGELRYYIRSDGEKIARNAKALHLFAGGFDKDSPYAVSVGEANGQNYGRVGIPDGPNGSPIGFEFRVITRFKTGSRNRPSWSVTHPNFDLLAASYKPEIYFTDPVTGTGVHYAQARAVDGNLGRDGRVKDALDFGEEFCWDEDLEEYPGAPPLCGLVMTWVTNFDPRFLTDVPEFSPDPYILLIDPSFEARLFIFDSDSTTTGGVRADFLVRVRFTMPGEQLPSSEGWQPLGGFRMKTGDTFPISIPIDLPIGLNEFEFELSDLPGEGRDQAGDRLEDRRTVFHRVPFYWQVQN
jgi:hypothetical protein